MELVHRIASNNKGLTYSRPAAGRPRPKIYAYRGSGNISQEFDGNASRLDFPARCSDFSQEIYRTASRLDFPYRSSNFSQEIYGTASKLDFPYRSGNFSQEILGTAGP